MGFQSDETTNHGDIMAIVNVVRYNNLMLNLCNGHVKTWDEGEVCQFVGNIMRYNAIYLNCIYQHYDDPP